MMQATAEREIKCMYCRTVFVPEPVVRKYGKKRKVYTECPCCGNGVERDFRPWDKKLVTVHAR